MIFPDDGIGGAIFPKDLADYLTGYYREHGVEVIAGRRCLGCRASEGDVCWSRPSADGEIESGAVVAGLGIAPTSRLPTPPGSTIDNGIAVDAFLRTSAPDIYAAGDVALVLQPRARQAHPGSSTRTTRLTMGEHAGRAMAGDGSPTTICPTSTPTSSTLATRPSARSTRASTRSPTGQRALQKGVVYYLKDGYLRGVLLWNVWDKVPEARELICTAGPFTAAGPQGADLGGVGRGRSARRRLRA